MTMVGLVVLAMSVLVLMPMSNEYPQLSKNPQPHHQLYHPHIHTCDHSSELQ